MVTIIIIILTVAVSLMCFYGGLDLDKLKFSAHDVWHRRKWWQLVTYGFVHGGWGHLFFNMLTLYFFGRVVEQYFAAVWGEPLGQILYMHDGQMLFDSTTTWNRQEWKVDEVLGRLMAEGSVKRTIVVGIDNTPERLRELLPGMIQSYMDADDIEDPAYALGDSYLKFVTEEVKPLIDSLYRPLTDREHTFIAGSSMGGLISLYALCEYPEVFGGAACLSSHISIAYLDDFTRDSDAAADAFLRYVSDMMPDRETTRLYMDYGKAGYDAAYGPYQERMDSLFLSRGWNEDHYRSLAFEGHDHNETCWASRLEIPITYLLGE